MIVWFFFSQLPSAVGFFKHFFSSNSSWWVFQINVFLVHLRYKKKKYPCGLREIPVMPMARLLAIIWHVPSNQQIVSAIHPPSPPVVNISRKLSHLRVGRNIHIVVYKLKLWSVFLETLRKTHRSASTYLTSDFFFPNHSLYRPKKT